MPACVAVINAEPSSVKFTLCGVSDNPDMLFRGQIESIGVNPRLSVKGAQGETLVERVWPGAGFNHD
jgi:acetate kinase